MSDLTALAEAVGVLELDEPPITTRDIASACLMLTAAYPLLVGVMLL
ncbi:hypothetical protein [Corynebacterium sanguinis]|nr:hypothetical protein [Corynebacterium sanguinis]